MNADAAYKRLVDGAARGEPTRVRGHVCLRLGFAQCTFRGFPLVTLRRTAWRTSLREMEWFLSGRADLASAPPSVRPWWEPWGDGAAYGRFAARFAEPALTIWDPSGPLPPCTYTGVTAVVHRGTLRVTMWQRSCDLICGAPHDWAQLWALSLWWAMRAEAPLGEVRWLCTDAHLYEAHLHVARALLEQPEQGSPGLAHHPSGDAFRADDFELTSPYRPSCEMRAELVV